MSEKVKNILRKPYQAMKKGKNLLSPDYHRTRSMKKMRQKARELNNYESPKRALVYVIYENQEFLQEYKLIFLKELVKLCQKVLIVVNGSLPEKDIAELSTYGQVMQRENNGYDAAAFRAGSLQLLDESLDDFDELLLVNDTSVGPFKDLNQVFAKMAKQHLDFWGISYGGQSPDVTGFNRYGYIPRHLQSYFLVIEKSMFQDASFRQYWEELGDTSSRDMAIGRHETVFTKYFEDLGFASGALSHSTLPGTVYFHPLTLIQEDDVPLVKYTAFENTTDIKFEWHGYTSHTEIPALLEFIQEETDYPFEIIQKIMDDLSKKVYQEFVLVIYEQMTPQLQEEIDKLQAAGEQVKAIEKSAFHISSGEHAKAIVYYQTSELENLSRVAKMGNIPILQNLSDLL